MYKKIQLLTVLYIWNSNQRIIIDISFNSASYTIYFLYLWMMWPPIGRSWVGRKECKVERDR